jgi:hypothetical protein
MGLPHTAKSDIYSFAIVLWELVYRLLTGKYNPPYKGEKLYIIDF